MAVTNSPDMNLPVPIVGSEAGPQWAIDINACLSIIDAHSHAPGSGVQITPSGLNINADLSIQANNLVDIRSVRYIVQPSPIALAADLNCSYVSGVDLYYNDGNGNQVRITQSGGVAGSPGSIANLTSPASASYVAINETFVWESNANVAAVMDFRSAILRNASANSFGLTLQAPMLGADITQTLPQLPGSTSFMTIASTGVMGATIPIALGITSSNLASDSVITSKILDANVTEPKLADDSVSTRTIIDGNVTQSKLAACPLSISPGSGSFSTTSSTPIAVTNLSVTIVSTGRPTIVQLLANNTGGGFQVNAAGGSPGEAFIRITRDSSTVQINRFFVVVGNVVGYPCGITLIDETPTAGAHTYAVQAYVTSSPNTILDVTNVRMIAYEL